jgi:hypothetical protein
VWPPVRQANVSSNTLANGQSEVAAGAAGAAAGAGVIETGVDGWTAFGAGCFLTAAKVDDAAGPGFGDDGVGAAAFADDAGGRDPARGGSAVMMLTGGVEAALGKSALVGLPVGIPDISAATGAAAGTDAGGMFQIAE